MKLVDEREKLMGHFLTTRLMRKDHYIINSSVTPYQMYWIKFNNIDIDDKAISMLNLPYVEYQDTWFYIKTFKKE